MRPPRDQTPAETPQGFFKATHALMMDKTLTATEKALVIAIGLYDWGNGNGCSVSNARLAEYCSLDTSTEDGGQRCVRRLVSGLAKRGYIRVVPVKQTTTNRTGRVIHLEPKAIVGPTEPRTSMSGVEAGTPDNQVPPPRTSMSGVPRTTKSPKEDSGLIDPRIDPSSGAEEDFRSPEDGKNGDAVVTERLSVLARKTFADPKRAERIISEFQTWFTFIDAKVPDPAWLIEVAIVKAKRARIGNEAGYALKVIEKAIDATKAKPAKPAKPAGQEPRRIKPELMTGDSSRAILDAKWSALADRDHEQIREMVRKESPELDQPRLKAYFHSACLDKMDQLFPPDDRTSSGETFRPAHAPTTM